MAPKISMGIPSRGQMWVKTGVSLAQMHGYNLKKFDYSKIHYAFGRTESNRNMLAKRAIEHGSTHILFIDTDMVFPENTAEILAGCDKDIIACNASITNEMSEAYMKPVMLNDVNGNPLDYSKEFQEVPAIGMAVALIKIDVFLDMALPWFEAPPRPGKECVMSEDIAFCHKARGKGFKIYCHNALSLDIGHIGHKTYKLFDTQEAGLMKIALGATEQLEVLKKQIEEMKKGK